MAKLTIHDAPAIIRDTREQDPWVFPHPTEIRTMKTGDYTMAGVEDLVVLERKRHGEFVQCMTSQRDRFVRELERARTIPHFHVIVEASLKGLIEGLYDDWPSNTNLNSIRGTLAAWSNRYPTVRFWFPGDRKAAAIWAEHLLKKTWLDTQLGKIEKEAA
jgi:ERCC4-type nuclease